MTSWSIRPAARSISRRLRRAAEALDGFASDGPSSLPAAAALDNYVEGPPSAQNAVDALQGWNMALPPEVGVTAGAGAFYADPRILWALDEFGPLEGRKVLELGPLEASHTYMIEQRRPASLLAVEANRLSFLRCLVVKELLDLKIARFELGNFAPWLETTGRRFDLIVASGVLYHMANPIRLLELLSLRADSVYLWTHYASDEAMPPGDPRRMAFVGEAEVCETHGVSVRCRKRSYWGAWKNSSFCGGLYDLHRWIEKDDILTLLGALGFDDVRTAHDEPDHHNGPAFSIFARRSR
ncbi:hypothetical protein DFR50_1314 [Roseiarcus fermentans]|uniref:Methyltransferase family protein n=1 Tax=Roseiarcus fermentans TaxID=1473586 RepID=A0A366EVM6_9HYPH|nr:hypothetical protein DFR50_1314 [Roseiarcus fermentans]